MHTYCILDGARMLQKLDQAKSLNQDSISLYSGLPLEILESVSPYIFYLEDGGSLSYWLTEQGWGKSWGIYVRSGVNGEDLYHHFRKFITVFTEQGKEMYFRFYDPRALRIFLPTCNENQLNEFFGPVDSFIMEDKDSEYAIGFKLKEGRLISSRIHKNDWFDELIPKDLNEENNDSETEEEYKEEETKSETTYTA